MARNDALVPVMSLLNLSVVLLMYLVTRLPLNTFGHRHGQNKARYIGRVFQYDAFLNNRNVIVLITLASGTTGRSLRWHGFRETKAHCEAPFVAVIWWTKNREINFRAIAL